MFGIPTRDLNPIYNVPMLGTHKASHPTAIESLNSSFQPRRRWTMTLGKKLKTTNVKHAEFDDITRSFVGLELSRPWRGYGTALFSEIGPLSHNYESSKRPKADRGLEFSWSWRVESVRSVLFGSSSSDQRINRGIASLVGLTIEGISLCGRIPELCVQLSGGIWITSYAASESQPDWSIFLSDGSWLTVRRGKVVREVKTPRKPE